MKDRRKNLKDTPLLRAQETLRRRLKQWARDIERDQEMRLALEGEAGMTFLVVLTACVSAIITEVAGPYSKTLRETDGIEKMTKFATDQMAEFLRQDLAGLLEHEAHQTRQ